jgi:hypothetical protein
MRTQSFIAYQGITAFKRELGLLGQASETFAYIRCLGNSEYQFSTKVIF